MKRHLEARLRFAVLEDSVIYLAGPRGSGKKTLYQSLQEQFPYLTFDDAEKLDAAKMNPDAFVKSLPPQTIIDNAPLAPEIFQPMGIFIDELRRTNNGYIASRFLLTGISNLNLNPDLLEHLTGKVKSLTLLPFCSGEIIDNGDINFIYDLFTKKSHHRQLENGHSLEAVIKLASFPEIALQKVKNEDSWFNQYMLKLIKDIEPLVHIDDAEKLQQIIMLLANKTGCLLDYDEFAKEIGIEASICQQYIALLQSFYLIILLETLDENHEQKIYFMDSAQLLSLLNKNTIDISIFRNFVASELTKHIEYLDKYPYRLYSDLEIDFVVKNMDDNGLIGIDLKYDTIVVIDDFKELQSFKNTSGENFIKGVILYLGYEIIDFGDELFAMPISSLWGGK